MDDPHWRTSFEEVYARAHRRSGPRAQLAWLEAELGRSTAAWTIVVGHHPVFSGGSDHGNQPELIRDVRPLLDRHGVRAYFFGHDHDLQHIMVDNVHYLGCCAGADTRPTTKISGSCSPATAPAFSAGRSPPTRSASPSSIAMAKQSFRRVFRLAPD
jgi:tartrate-resistant acid phosphatase type 5